MVMVWYVESESVISYWYKALLSISYTDTHASEYKSKAGKTREVSLCRQSPSPENRDLANPNRNSGAGGIIICNQQDQKEREMCFLLLLLCLHYCIL